MKDAASQGKSMLELVVEHGILSREEVERVFDPRTITEPGILKRARKGGTERNG